MKTGIAIAKRREEIGMTQEQLADFVGVSKATISRWESGDISNMRRDRIQKIAAALQISPLDLLYEDIDKGFTIAKAIEQKSKEKHQYAFVSGAPQDKQLIDKLNQILNADDGEWRKILTEMEPDSLIQLKGIAKVLLQKK